MKNKMKYSFWLVFSSILSYVLGSATIIIKDIRDSASSTQNYEISAKFISWNSAKFNKYNYSADPLYYFSSLEDLSEEDLVNSMDEFCKDFHWVVQKGSNAYFSKINSDDILDLLHNRKSKPSIEDNLEVKMYAVLYTTSREIKFINSAKRYKLANGWCM